MRSNLKVGSMMIGPVQTNCYYIYRDTDEHADSIPCIFFDPADRGDYIYRELTNRHLRVELILLTHAHFDHISGAHELKLLTKAPVYCWEQERRLCGDTDANLSSSMGHPVSIVPDRWLRDGEEIEADDMTCRVIGTPGHTEGSCCYYFEEGHILVSGDTVFAGSVGRTDFPTGSMSTLVRSIQDRLLQLPDDTVIYPGHGPATTIGEERRYNEYFNML